MRTTRRRVAIALIAVLGLALGPSWVVAQPLSLSPVRVRGVIEKIDEGVVTIRTRDGRSVVVQVSHNRSMIAVTRASLAGRHLRWRGAAPTTGTIPRIWAWLAP